MSNYESDIIIIGGGVAGVCSAIAARRMGVRVLLLEKNQYFGGMATGAWVHSCLTFHSRFGQRIVDGIPQEIIDRLSAIGGSPGHIRDTVGVAYSVTPTDSDRFKFVLQSFLDEVGVNYLLETKFLDASMDGIRIRHISGIHSGGNFIATAPVFIDASGEGALAKITGNSYERGQNGKTQPATLIFKVRNVNFKPIFRYMWSHMDDFHNETRFDLLKNSPAVGVSGFFRLWKMANLNIPRDRLLFYQTLYDDEVAINSTRVQNFDALDPDSLNRAHWTARSQMYEILDFLREWVPGFGFCRFAGEAPLLGVREALRIKGKYVLCREDVIEGKRFPDEIALGGFPIDIHSSSTVGIESSHTGGEGFYGIPFRCLQPEVTPNLLITGKCFSADFAAHASARVQATAMALGQAAGAAGALAVLKRIDPSELSPDAVRQAVAELGGLLEPAGREELR